MNNPLSELRIEVERAPTISVGRSALAAGTWWLDAVGAQPLLPEVAQAVHVGEEGLSGHGEDKADPVSDSLLEHAEVADLQVHAQSLTHVRQPDALVAPHLHPTP